jgi:hypothetical protein
MEKRLPWYEMTADQRRIHIDTAQLHSAYVDASSNYRSYRGGMHWKTAKGLCFAQALAQPPGRSRADQAQARQATGACRLPAGSSLSAPSPILAR